MVHSGTISSYRLVGQDFDLAWFNSLFSERLSIVDLHGAMFI